MNFLLVQDDLELVLQLVRDHAGRHGAEQLAVVAGLDLDQADEFGDALGQFAHGVELMGFAFGAALFERLDAALVGAGQRDRVALRQQVVARVAGGHFDLVGFTAKTDDVVSENDFSFCHTK